MLKTTNKDKQRFVQTKIWKEWRIRIAFLHDNKDDITKKKLGKKWNCHHKDLHEENYRKLIPENFAALNQQTHDFVHWAYKYYKNDEGFLVRLENILKEMKKLSETD